jgi:hypothetical protein
VSENVKDGIVRLLVKSDVEALKRKDKLRMVVAHEQVMAEGWALSRLLLVEEACDAQEAFLAVGRLFVRSTLHLVGKSKIGFEKREYASINDIKDVFAAEIFALFPKGAVPSRYGVAPPNVVEAKAASSKDVAVAMENMSDPVYKAKDAGFVVGAIVYEKTVGVVAGLYDVKAIGADGARLEQRKLAGDATIVTVDIEELLHSWGEFKGEPPVAFATESVERYGFSYSETVRMDSVRCKAYEAIKARMASGSAPAVQYNLRPTEVIVLEAYAKGKLELVAFTDLSRFSAKKIDSAPVVSIGSDKLYLQEPSRPKTQKDDDWKDDMLFVTFWWVATTTDEGSSNMELMKRTVDGVAMPIYVNKRKVLKFERLAVYKPKVVVKPLASVKTATVEKAKRARVE